MQQYNVPQFVDNKDKILGPLTIVEFFLLVGGLFFIFLLWLIFNLTFLFWVLGVPVLSLTIFVAFGRLNGAPMINNFLPLISYLSLPKTRIFTRGQSNTEAPPPVVAKPAEVIAGENVQSRLRRLAYVLDQNVAREQEVSQQIKKPE